MRGRLPEAKQAPSDQRAAPTAGYPRLIETQLPFTDACPGSLHNSRHSYEPSDEEIALQGIAHEMQEQLRRVLSDPATRVTPHLINQREHMALMGIARIVQQDMLFLQAGLSRAARPPDERDGEYTPAPDWDDEYLTALIDGWNEPVLLESDYYLLRSMCLYELAVSVQVKVLRLEKVQKFLNMALTLALKGYRILQEVLVQGDIVDKYWRYPLIISYVQRQQVRGKIALGVIAEIKEHEALTGLPAPECLHEKTSQHVFQAMYAFRQGMKSYPNISTNANEALKDQEWNYMATLSESYTLLLRDFHSRQNWTQHTVELLTGALRENKNKSNELLERISKAYLRYALWIHEQPDYPMCIVPKPCPMFLEMRKASIFALVYAKKVLDTGSDEDLRPKHYRQMIDCLYMMSLVCVSSHLIHSFSREASYWIDQLKSKFPQYRIEPYYLHAAKLMNSKDNAIQSISDLRRSKNV
ncbi:hypothetical protein BGZ51_004771 [Haplosporangium sp. Z 767]|nr:hypothetical protein BGZ51_004771 [Haplosporangium sp. Z 767]KAF9195977.1 hypothetical protein BGZ50_002779 [Haplosporangium sp. Z 11]